MRIFKNKKADDLWEKLGNWIFVIIILVVVLIVLFLFRDQILRGIQKIADILNFGG